MGGPVGVSSGPCVVERPVRRGFQLVVQDHALHGGPVARELGLHLAHHPEQAGVVPDFARLDPAAVVHLSLVVLGIAMMVEQRLAPPA